MATVGELTKDSVIRDACEWTTDMEAWLPVYFVLRKGQVGGFELLYFKDPAMSIMAGMTITLDLKTTTVEKLPDHDYTLKFENRRGRTTAVSFQTKGLMQKVGESLGVPIAGLKSGSTPGNAGRIIAEVAMGLPNRVDAPRSKTLNTQRPPSRRPRPMSAELAELEADLPSVAVDDSQQKSMKKCIGMIGKQQSLPAGPMTQEVRKISNSTTGSIREGMPPLSPTKRLFHEDPISLELSPSEQLLSVVGQGNGIFQEEILPHLDANASATGLYFTKMSFAEVSAAFLGLGWCLKKCNVQGDNVVQCTFERDWGKKILDKLQELDSQGKKKELMEALFALGLSLDLQSMTDNFSMKFFEFPVYIDEYAI